MATSQIQLTKSGTTNAVPAASELAQGELALNYADGKLYFKNGSNQIEQLNSVYRGSGGVITVNEIDTHIGLDTVSSSMRNANLQLRADPTIQKKSGCWWGESTINADPNPVGLK